MVFIDNIFLLLRCLCHQKNVNILVRFIDKLLADFWDKICICGHTEFYLDWILKGTWHLDLVLISEIKSDRKTFKINYHISEIFCQNNLITSLNYLQ